MAIPLKLQVFEGPMDLLMHLIEKNKIDIYDIPIVTITDQYLEYVHRMEHDDMNVTSEFLVMAATLLDIKSRMLLPREENEEGEEEDPRDELVRRLLEYKMYKFMSEELKEKERHAGMSYFKPQDLPEEVRSYVPPLNYEELIGDRTVQSLGNVFKEVLKRKKSRVDPIRSGFGKIQREEISVADKELYIRAYLAGHPHADFREMLELQDSKEEIIVTFLVILELMKNQKIRITQEEAFGKIMIDLIDPEEKKTEETPEPEEEPVPAEPEAEPGPVETEPEAEPVPAEPEVELIPTEPEEEPVPAEPNAELIPAEPEAEPVPAEPEMEPAPESEPEVELIPEEPEAEPVPEETQMEPIPAEPEPKPVSELAPAEPEPEAKPAPEEPEPEPSPVSGSRPVKRHLIYSPRQHRLGAGRYAFRFTARRARKDLYRRARGNRIWRRKRRRRR